MQLFNQSVKRLLFPGLILLSASMQVNAQAPETANSQTKSTKANASVLKVSGVVTDATTKKPIPGISVSVLNYSAALTDDKGGFKISIPNQDAVLVVSSQGFQTKYVAIKGQKSLKISLFEDTYNSVYDAIKLPFDSQPKSQTTYSAVTINTDGSWNRPAETIDTYLQGKAAGLDVSRRAGTPGIGSDLILRGYNSVLASNQPLVVVDGMIFDNNNYANSNIAGFRTNHLANIDLKDVDNITILKDGSNLYGTRGANGVILITTGRAKGEATRLDFSAYGGVNTAVRNLPVMGASDFRTYLADLMKTNGLKDAQIQSMPYMNDNIDPVSNPDYYNYHKNTNWQDKVMGSGKSQNYYLKVSGGDNVATYALSMGYSNNEGIIKNTDLTRYQTRFNANLNLTPKLKAQANLAFTRSEQMLKNTGYGDDTNPLFLGLVKAPFLNSHVLSTDNVESPNLSNYDVFNVSNPAAVIENMNAKNRNYRFTGSVGFNYAIKKSLSLQSLVGLTYDKVRENIFRQGLGIVPIQLSTAIGKNAPEAGIEKLFSLYTDTWLNYKKALNNRDFLTTNLGFRYNSSQSESDFGIAYNTASDEFVTLGSAQSALRYIGGGLGKWNWLNTYFNAEYNSRNKYFLTFNLAADASSRFGKDIPDALTVNGVKMALLPGVGAAWLISSEPFMADAKDWVETLKLRANYSVSGNDDIGNFSAKKYYVSQNLLGRQGLVSGNIGNSALQWEKVLKFNLGLDAAFLEEKLNVSIDYFNNHTRKMLLNVPAPSLSGFDVMLTNNGAMQNSGFELSLNSRLISSGKLKYDLGLNVATYKTKLTRVDEGISQTYAGATYLLQKGQAPNLYYGYKTNGVYINSAEAAASGLKIKLADGSLVPVQAGDVKFLDLDGNNEINENDRGTIGDPNPDLLGALVNHLSYKRWSFDALFCFSIGNDLYNGTRNTLESMSTYYNQTPVVLNRWRVDGQVTDMPRASFGDPTGNARFSDRWIEDGSYLRLRTLSAAYDIPVKAGFLKSATVYAVGNNLLTFTKYLGYDPEFSASASPFARGVDTGLEPQFKSVQLGVRIGL